MIPRASLKKIFLLVCLALFPIMPLYATEATNSAGNKILKTAYQMAFVQKTNITGSCYDFINAVYKRAGYPPAKRQTIFTASKKGPYADIDLIQPGDWIMHINLEYYSMEHSLLFVSWIDKDKKLALVLDHAGMNRTEPGKYRDHDLSKVYRIIRARGE